MAEIPKRYFQRFFTLGGIFFVVFILFFVIWTNDKAKLEKLESSISYRFKEFKVYKNDVYLPKIKLLGPNGAFVNFRKNGGKHTILNIWSTRCKPCINNLTSLSRLNKTLPYDSNWRVIAVSVDKKSNLGKVAKLSKHYGVEKIANYNDYNSDLQKNIKVSRLPMTLIINKSGRILYEIHGMALWHDKDIVDFLSLVNKVH